MQQKILLVGDPRICPQVAYVMDWQNFEQVEQLTDIERYRNYKIVVCAFKRNRKHFLKIKGTTAGIIFLDDLCRELDQVQSGDSNVATVEPWSFWRRVGARIKNGEVRLSIVRRLKRHLTLRSYRLINHLPVATLRLSELFLKVLYSKPSNIECERLENNCEINDQGEMIACCGIGIPFGRIQDNGDVGDYNGIKARIIKLSSLNRSYCLCDKNKCLFATYTSKVDVSLKQIPRNIVPKVLGINTDRACNLKCPMCRSDYSKTNETTVAAVGKLHTALQAAGWLEKADCLMLAGMGEIFYSPSYQQLLKENWQQKKIHVISNGILFNRHNWLLLKNKYEQIEVAISVDAATAETYRKLRGGNFKVLMDNLTFISSLRRENEICDFSLLFVVQKANYQEMKEFIALAKSLHADHVLFTHLNNYGAFTKKEYRQQSLILKNGCLNRELYYYLQDPIFNDAMVNLTAFQPYLVASAKRYGE